jgi:hypothetical protein
MMTLHLAPASQPDAGAIRFLKPNCTIINLWQ